MTILFLAASLRKVSWYQLIKIGFRWFHWREGLDSSVGCKDGKELLLKQAITLSLEGADSEENYNEEEDNNNEEDAEEDEEEGELLGQAISHSFWDD